jgi:hypothetical protein
MIKTLKTIKPQIAALFLGLWDADYSGLRNQLIETLSANKY